MSGALGMWLLAEESAQAGLQWDDAAIGAVAAFGLMFVLLGLGLAIRYGRRRSLTGAQRKQPSEEQN